MPVRPTVAGRALITGEQGGASQAIPLDSPTWFAWLADPANQGFRVLQPDGVITVRREQKQRGGSYWVAYRRVRGKMYKRYLGRPAEVSADRLEAAITAIRALAATGAVASPTAPARPVATTTPPPPLDHATLPRPRLTARVPLGRLGQLTTICAPAGYGKSTLLQELAAQSPWPVAALALEESDNDGGRFWPRLIGALVAVRPELASLPGLSLAVTAEQLSGGYTAVIRDALADATRPLLLLIDDAHLLTAPVALNALAALVYPPPAGCHIVLASRTAPQLPLARLRAGGQLTELGLNDLQLTPAEAAQVLARAGAPALSDGQREALHQRTEGWAAGLRLAVLALRQSDDPDALLAALSGDHPFIFDYLAEELFARQPPQLQRVLVLTAVLDRVCAELCAALLGEPEGGPALFEAALRAGLLLLPADRERRWYRYHPLMAAFLRGRLAQTAGPQEREVHRRAAAWFAEAGDIPAAIQHALASEDHAAALELIDTHATTWLWRHAATTTVSAWLDALPADLARSSPRLCLIRLWLRIGYSLDESEGWLADARRALPASPAVLAFERGEGPPPGVNPDERLLLGMLALMETYVLRTRHGPNTEAAAASLALAWLPPDESLYRSMVMVNLGFSALMGGELARAEQSFIETIRMRKSPARVHSLPRAAYALMWIQLRRGAVGRAAQTVEVAETTTRAISSHRWPQAAILRLGRAILAYERNDLAEAEGQLANLDALGSLFDPDGLIIDLLMLRARVCVAGGRFAEAESHLDEAERLAIGYQGGGTGESRLAEAVVGCGRAWALCRGGQGQAAQARLAGWASTGGRERPDNLLVGEYIATARARAALACGRPEEALAALGPAAAGAFGRGHLLAALTLGLLEARAHTALGDQQQALAALARALPLAEACGFFRLVLDEGPELVPLLWRALGHGIAPAYVRRLLDAFAGAGVTAPPDETALAEPFSDREREVLALLGEGHTTAAIACRLVIAESTVKWHLRNIYGKLGVANRVQAITRARALGMLA